MIIGLRPGGLAAANNMLVRSSMFDHKNLHKHHECQMTELQGSLLTTF